MNSLFLSPANVFLCPKHGRLHICQIAKELSNNIMGKRGLLACEKNNNGFIDLGFSPTSFLKGEQQQFQIRIKTLQRQNRSNISDLCQENSFSLFHLKQSTGFWIWLKQRHWGSGLIHHPTPFPGCKWSPWSYYEPCSRIVFTGIYIVRVYFPTDG